MGKPLPLALRERVAAFVDEGHSNREASRHFRVSPLFVNNLMKLRGETGRWSRAGKGTGLAAASLLAMSVSCARVSPRTAI